MSSLECGGPAVPSWACQSAAEIHGALKQALTEIQRAEKSAVLCFAEIMRRRLYRELGYSSIHLYASEALGFNPSRTSQFIRLAESLEKLPALKASVARGEVSWTKAREVARVATPASETAWVAEAKTASRRELERKVAEVKESSRRERRADPSQQSLTETMAVSAEGHAAQAAISSAPAVLSFRMEALQLARFGGLMEKLRKLGLAQSREEILLEGLAALAVEIERLRRSQSEAPSAGPGEDFPRGKSRLEGGVPDKGLEAVPADFPRGNSSPFQIVLYQCERCGEAQAVTSRGMRPVSRSALERAQCDGKVQERDGRNRSIIPPATRRAVLARDGHRCQVKGCSNTRFLEVHHVTPRAKGGGNDADNLFTICSGCHALLHERGLADPRLALIGSQRKTHEPEPRPRSDP